MPAPIVRSADGLDLSARVQLSTTVAGNPANAGEASVCRLTLSGDIAAVSGVLLVAWLAITVGLNGTALRLRVRRATVAGMVVADTDAIPESAADHVVRVAFGFDTGASLPGQVYVLTSETVNATNPSTVGAVTLAAIVV